MSEWVCESPLGVSTSDLSYPMFAVNWPRGHVNTRANKSMTTVSVIEDISDIVSISRGFMEYPHPLHMLWRHSLNSVTAYSKPYRLNHCVGTFIQLQVYFKTIITTEVIYETFKSMPWCQYRTYYRYCFDINSALRATSFSCRCLLYTCNLVWVEFDFR